MQTVKTVAIGLKEALLEVPDPRALRGRRYEMTAMLTALVCGILCGVQSFRALDEWLKLQPLWFRHWLGFPRGTPSRFAFSKLLAKLPPVILEAALNRWLSGFDVAWPELELSKIPAAVFEMTEVWDGKTLRGTRFNQQRACQQLVRMDLATSCVLSQTPIDLTTNEAAVALKLLQEMITTGEIKGKTIVADAAFCQREICQAIVDSGGDYVVTVKKNQPQLLRDISNAFLIPEGFPPLCG